MRVRPWQRRQLVRTAIGLTSCPDDPAAVAAAASVLLAWAQQATVKAGRTARFEALSQQESARSQARDRRRREPPRPDPWVDNLGEFPPQAQVLYEFAVADDLAWRRS